MPAAELTEDMITMALARANARVCVGSDRCYAFPDRLEDGRATCTPKGRCKVGWNVSRGGRDSFDVWLEVSTGLVKLIRHSDPASAPQSQLTHVSRGRSSTPDC